MKRVYIQFVDEQKNAATERICDETGIVSSAVLQLYVTNPDGQGFVILNFPLFNILQYNVEHIGK